MNRSLVNCSRPQVEFPFLVREQMVILTVANSIVMVGNIITNVLVILILIKTNQIANNTCKMFFVLSTSDLLIGLFFQNLQTVLLYEKKKCLLLDIYAAIGMFLVHLSMYAIALTGIDRYLRIKHYAKFKVAWTTRVVSTFISIEVFLAFFQIMIGIIDPLSGKEYTVFLVYYTIDGLIISGMIFLEVLTMRTSNAVCNKSTIAASRNTDKKITKLSMQIMLLFCCFTTPQLIMYVLREFMQDILNDFYEKSSIGFFTVASTIVLYANSFVNAVLFLMKNVRAKRYLRNLSQCWERSL